MNKCFKILSSSLIVLGVLGACSKKNEDTAVNSTTTTTTTTTETAPVTTTTSTLPPESNVVQEEKTTESKTTSSQVSSEPNVKTLENTPVTTAAHTDVKTQNRKKAATKKDQKNPGAAHSAESEPRGPGTPASPSIDTP